MAALVCEICGGKLVAKANGVFECEFCGMTFEKERVVQLIHEVKGTVKVENTFRVEQNINVSGTVKVEGGLNAANYIKRGQIALQDRKWEAAMLYFHQALDFDPENGEAYLGLAKAEARVPDDRWFGHEVERGVQINNANYRKAKKFSKEIAERFAPYERAHYQRAADHAAAVKRQKEEAAAKQKAEMSAMLAKYHRFKGMLAACKDFTVGVNVDGTVRVTPGHEDFTKGVENWSEITAVAASGYRVVGLRADGTVRVTGSNFLASGNWSYVRSWSNVVSIAASNRVIAGLKKDGTVYLDSEDQEQKQTVEGWKDICEISVGVYGHVLGLKEDGTVVAAGENDHGQCNVSDWKDIVAISAGQSCSAAVDSEGKVWYKGLFTIEEQKKWKKVVSVVAGCSHLIGLDTDGKLLVAGESKYGACKVTGWRDAVAVVTTDHHTVALLSDGTVVATKFVTDGIYTDEGQSNVSGWRLFQSMETLDKERKEGYARVRPIMAEKKAQVQQTLSQLKQDLPNIKGLFTGGRRKKTEVQIEELEETLKGF